MNDINIIQTNQNLHWINGNFLQTIKEQFESAIEVANEIISEVILDQNNNIYNNNINHNMRKEKVYRYDNKQYNHNKNIQAKSDRLHYILKK